MKSKRKRPASETCVGNLLRNAGFRVVGTVQFADGTVLAGVERRIWNWFKQAFTIMVSGWRLCSRSSLSSSCACWRRRRRFGATKPRRNRRATQNPRTTPGWPCGGGYRGRILEQQARQGKEVQGMAKGWDYRRGVARTRIIAVCDANADGHMVPVGELMDRWGTGRWKRGVGDLSTRASDSSTRTLGNGCGA